jgi:hypothetical protein
MWIDVLEKRIAYPHYRKSTQQETSLRQVVKQISDPEDRDNIYFRNVGSYMDYAALYPRRCQDL